MNFLRRLFGGNVEVQDDATFRRGWEQRATEYAKGIKTPYWRGRLVILPLPALPGEAGQCGKKCTCKWDVKVINAKRGDYDAYWVLADGDAKHCQTCLVRAESWAPLRIRGGQLQ